MSSKTSKIRVEVSAHGFIHLVVPDAAWETLRDTQYTGEEVFFEEIEGYLEKDSLLDGLHFEVASLKQLPDDE